MSKPEKILARELLEREVLDLAAGQIIGRVIDFALTRDGRVAQIGVLINAWYEGGRGLPPAAIASVHRDHVCIEDSAGLAEFAPDGEASFSLKGDALLGRQVLQQDGELLGELFDFCFEFAEGQITDLIVLAPTEKRVKVPVEKIRTIGHSFIVVERGVLVVGAAELQAGEEETLPGEELAAEDGGPGENSLEPAGSGATAGERALFGDAHAQSGLSRFDEKKRDYLLGRPAHRDISSPAGELLIAKGGKLDGKVIQRIIEAELLNDVFIEMTLTK